ncbi:unnamed protein product [Dracunculus medinensis]|uniref:Thyroglobulin type-1 domain-containing protein n=1 Tax=Dracunculus medinensis TaxID=318479 RepID=A0A0N4UR21_DRAME|nr:unnamed protein product [Dracunculus medinensis]
MDVAWMFQQWDGNNDDTDPGNDGIITLDEWCDCFAWIHDSRHEPPCHIAKHRDDPHLFVLGVFHPQCTLEGYYKSEQCHNNWCWCVDKYGREFDNSRVHDQLPDCGQYGEN